MRRVLIIGPCGSGKSTLARELAPLMGLSLVHMDQLGWQAGWVETEKAELNTRLAEVVAQDAWLIEGNYGSTLAPRLARADTVIYLDFPIRLCLARLIRRIVTHRGRSRPDMPEGCPERFDAAFFWYVMNWNIGPRVRTEAKLAGYSGKVIRLRSPAALTEWRLRSGLA
ncbi:topology modulation protein [Porphyrobacter sp. SLTP]|uniref:topology modulation protein n=1 Tax=Porphyrobacter sp. SLTP TaxID=2683266 RepID=UPI001412DB9E|nr:topology modulation protein [Porphyrobacter sp. SLTP]NBB24908.1 topology modulation protein [Porphyrobacter sp. SLTP]